MNGAALIIECPGSLGYEEVQAKVASIISEQWKSVGAQTTTEPTANNMGATLIQTGRLAVGLAFAGTNKRSTHEVVALCDSEEYSVDLRLAETISRELPAKVHALQLGYETGWLQSYNKGKPAKPNTKFASVVRKASQWPGVLSPAGRHGSRDLLSFGELRSIENCTVLNFKNLPHHPDHPYSGPPQDIDYGFESAPGAWLDSSEFTSIVEEATQHGRLHSWKCFDKELAQLPTGQRSYVAGKAWDMRDKEPLLAFRLQEYATHFSGHIPLWQKALQLLLGVSNAHGLSESRLERLLHLSRIRARLDHEIWHALVCAYAKLGDVANAKGCIVEAIHRGLAHDEIRGICDDEQLDLIRDDEDMVQLFAASLAP